MNGPFDIIFLDNDFEAYIKVKNLNNIPKSKEQLEQLLQRMEVNYGIDADRLQNFLYLISKNEITEDKYLIAKGKKPSDGENGDLLVISNSYEEESEFTNYHLINEKIDFRYYGQPKPLFVKKGDVIGFYRPPTKGIRGITVKGKIVKARDGVDVNFHLGQNVYMKYNKIYSKVDGILNCKLENDRIFINVEDVLVIKGDIDYSSGNIEFPGTIVIKGDIKPTFEVVAGKDIYVKGIISSKASAGGDIIVTNGITGDELEDKYSNVIAKGVIRANFIQFSNVNSNSKIIVFKHVIHSSLYSNDWIEVKGFPGKIIGSKLIALKGIVANIIGSKISIPTYLFAGFTYNDYIKYQKYTSEIKRLSKVASKIDYYLGEKKDENTAFHIKLEDIKNKKLLLEDKINNLNNVIEKIEKRMKKHTKAKIEVCQEIWPDVVININNIIYKTVSKSGPGYFQLNPFKDEIIFIDTKY